MFTFKQNLTFSTSDNKNHDFGVTIACKLDRIDLKDVRVSVFFKILLFHFRIANRMINGLRGPLLTAFLPVAPDKV